MTNSILWFCAGACAVGFWTFAMLHDYQQNDRRQRDYYTKRLAECQVQVSYPPQGEVNQAATATYEEGRP